MATTTFTVTELGLVVRQDVSLEDALAAATERPAARIFRFSTGTEVTVDQLRSLSRSLMGDTRNLYGFGASH